MFESVLSELKRTRTVIPGLTRNPVSFNNSATGCRIGPVLNLIGDPA
jgi:hypothetical protein